MKPVHKTKYSAGADVSATKTVTILPGKVAMVPTGSYVPESLPKDAFLMLCARSSIACKRGVMLVNGVGVIDSDYKDEILAAYINVTDEPVTIHEGERVGQLIPISYHGDVFECEQVDRNGGFGSTGSN